MTPRMTIIAAAIRKLIQGGGTEVEPSDPYWDNVVLAMRMDAVGDSDPLWSNVTLAMHMEGTNGSTTFTDLKGKTVTPSGNAQISTTQSKFGGASAYFDGVGDYLTLSGSTDFAFGTGDFTVECWFYATVVSVWNSLFTTGDNGSSQFTLRLSSTNKIQVFFGNTTANVLPSTIAANTWYHVAVSRASGVTAVYLNGVLELSWADTNNYTGSNRPTIGARVSSVPSYDLFFNGYIDDLRITKGVARYTANFTPPTSAFPSAPQFIDEKGHTVTPNGNAVIQSTTKRFGTGAAYFDGSGDFLKIPMSSDFDMGSGDFTIEFWYWPINAVASDRIILTRDGDLYPGIYLAHDSATQLLFLQSVDGTSYYGSGITFSITQNVWQHIAIVKSSGLVKAYLNGTDVGIDYPVVGSMYYSSSDYMVIGGQTSGRTINGYIDDLRITKGVARYTSSFTPTNLPVRVVDTLASQVVSLIRFDGVSGGTTITDETGVVWTKAASDITTETDIKKYGPSAGKFINTVKYSTGAVVNIGNNQSYCIECWVYLTSGGEYQGIFDIAGTLYVYVNNLNILAYQVQGGYVMSTALDLNRWYHIAIIRTGTSVQFTLDGVVIGTATSTTQYINAVMNLGYSVSVTGTSNGLRGRMDNFRLTVGSPRYTTTPFVPADCEYLT